MELQFVTLAFAGSHVILAAVAAGIGYFIGTQQSAIAKEALAVNKQSVDLATPKVHISAHALGPCDDNPSVQVTVANARNIPMILNLCIRVNGELRSVENVGVLRLSPYAEGTFENVRMSRLFPGQVPPSNVDICVQSTVEPERVWALNDEAKSVLVKRTNQFFDLRRGIDFDAVVAE